MKIGSADGIDLGLKSRQFTMKSNAKAFQILSSGLYSNKIRAVIREISCNAYDSHIEAGTADKPFDVQLPGYSNNIFYVRDYGTGLTEDEIFNVYTTYFESTKSDSNDYTGALGLGSKSPFCMADSFTIEAFKDGSHKTFLAFIGKSGMPELSKISEADTSEPNGLKVSLEVKDDFYKWRDEATDLFAWFPVKPNVICEDGFSHKVIEKVAKLSDTVTVLHANSLKWSERLVITQGTVAYPVSTNDLSTYFGDYDFLNDMHLLFEVPIGSVDITASRESISFVEYTVKNLKAQFDEIKELLLEKIDSELLNCNGNPWKLNETMAKMRAAYPSKLIKQSAVITNHAMYTGREYSSENFTLPYLKYVNNKTKAGVVTVTEYSISNSKIRTDDMSKTLLPSHTDYKVMNNVHVIVNNTTRGMMPTLRLYVKQHSGLHALIVIDFTDRKKYNTRVVNNILKDLADPTTVVYADKMKRPITNGVTAGSVAPKELTVKMLSNISYGVKWHTEKFDEEKLDEMFFVDLDNHTIMDNDYYQNIKDLIYSTKQVLPGAFFKDKKICGMTKTQKKRFAKAGIEVNSLFTEIERYINNIDFEKLISDQSAASDAPDFVQNSTFKTMVADGKCTVPEMVQLVDIVSAQKNTKEISVHDIKRLVNNLKLEVSFDEIDRIVEESQGATKDVKVFSDNIYAVCPMAEHFHAGYYESENAYKALIEYINNQYA